MKSFSFIIGFLILALALKPCTDGFNITCEDDKKVATSHSHEDDQDDSCAIFCLCNCCGMLVVYQQPDAFTVQEKIPISTQLNSYYEWSYHFDISVAIWQPPRCLS